jgi:hypothetical protein
MEGPRIWTTRIGERGVAPRDDFPPTRLPTYGDRDEEARGSLNVGCAMDHGLHSMYGSWMLVCSRLRVPTWANPQRCGAGLQCLQWLGRPTLDRLHDCKAS